MIASASCSTRSTTRTARATSAPELFEAFTKDAKSHAAAEEQALYSTMMRKPETTEETRHSVHEHYAIEKSLNDIAATEPSTRTSG